MKNDNRDDLVQITGDSRILIALASGDQGGFDNWTDGRGAQPAAISLTT